MIDLDGATVLILILAFAVTAVATLFHLARDTRRKGNW